MMSDLVQRSSVALRNWSRKAAEVPELLQINQRPLHPQHPLAPQFRKPEPTAAAAGAEAFRDKGTLSSTRGSPSTPPAASEAGSRRPEAHRPMVCGCPGLGSGRCRPALGQEPDGVKCAQGLGPSPTVPKSDLISLAPITTPHFTLALV